MNSKLRELFKIMLQGHKYSYSKKRRRMIKDWIKVVFALVVALGLGISSADAQIHHSTSRRVVVTPRVVHTHHTFRYVHTPSIVLYGSFAQYQQFGYAVIGYNNLVGVQGLCDQYGFQIVQVNPVQNFVVVRLPSVYSWNTIATFSRVNHVRFIEPGLRRY